jgi:hypothetical protein
MPVPSPSTLDTGTPDALVTLASRNVPVPVVVFVKEKKRLPPTTTEPVKYCVGAAVVVVGDVGDTESSPQPASASEKHATTTK